ncbi:GNAT family N-acetyltransferase [Cellulomonas sp. URHE0023]|uniref:GNAT family N-acetyltransferase n=1 Tax=Cellulomonas sp. URHE0023 TaxID=1380354 RepID=UPI00048508F3|nr:GNAT family protein [Cellulomonas sp. URHE0023]
MTALTDLWPVADLRVTCGDLSLEFLDDARLVELAALAGEGIHDPDVLPFNSPWSKGTPTEVARRVLAYQWAVRGSIEPNSWRLELALVRDGEVLGVQGAFASDFPVTRTAETGSWLGRRHQGHGLATPMRLMMLHLLFEGLGAQVATTAAFADNAASQAVTRRIGYTPNGLDRVAREGAAVESRRFVLSRADWARVPRPEITLSGVEPVRELLGL